MLSQPGGTVNGKKSRVLTGEIVLNSGFVLAPSGYLWIMPTPY